MPDLEDLLSDAWRDRTEAVAGDPGLDPAGLAFRVRRRRTRRHVLQATVSLPVVAALALGAWTLAGRTAQVPPVTQTPAPSPTWTVSPEPTAGLVPAPAIPGLPDRFLMPDGLLARTGPGWVLATYAAPEPDGGESAIDAVLLVSPGGVVYQVALLDGAPADGGAPQQVEIVDWQPGSSTAIVMQRSYAPGLDGLGTYARLDLTSGTVSPVEKELGSVPGYGGRVGGAEAWTDGTDNSRLQFVADGQVVRTDLYLATVRASPDGSTFWAFGEDASGDRRLEVLDAATREVLETGDAFVAAGCWPVHWWTASSILAECSDGPPSDGEPILQTHPRLEVFGLDEIAAGSGTLLRTLRVGDPVVADTARVADRTVVIAAQTLTDRTTGRLDWCGQQVHLLTNGAFTPLPLRAADRFRVAGADGRVLVEPITHCEGMNAGAGPLLAIDPATGATTTLLDVPPGVEDPRAFGTDRRGLTGWSAGP